MTKPIIRDRHSAFYNDLIDRLIVTIFQDEDDKAYKYIGRYHLDELCLINIDEQNQMTPEESIYEICKARRNTAFIVGGMLTDKETCLDFIRKNYPDDFEWLMWHQEIFRGEFDDDT